MTHSVSFIVGSGEKTSQATSFEEGDKRGEKHGWVSNELKEEMLRYAFDKKNLAIISRGEFRRAVRFVALLTLKKETFSCMGTPVKNLKRVNSFRACA